jgi:nucleoside-diphosphate-sugar epimerase
VGDRRTVASDSALRAVLTHDLDVAIPCDVVFANGVTDPRHEPHEIEFSNLEFPRRVVDALAPIGDFRFVTVGSIQERFPDACAQNRYLASKLAIARWVEQSARSSAPTPGRFLHVRLHTLYGGKPAPHMFLGQLLASLKDRKPFQMSSGTQLREYQHADDIAEAFCEMMVRAWDLGPVVEVSTGEPVRLAALARAVFAAFGADALLQIGSRTTPAGENLDVTFPRSPTWLLPKSRAPIPGVIEMLRWLLGPVEGVSK